MLKTVDINGKTYEYEFCRKRIRNINMRMRRDGSVSVSAPAKTPFERVEKFISAHSDFFIKSEIQRGKYFSAVSEENDFSDGAKKRVFGGEYILKSVKSEKNGVFLSDDTVYIQLKEPNEVSVRRVFEKWLRSEFEKRLLSYCKDIFSEFEKYHPEFPVIKIRKMVSRWGSCAPRKNILTFNLRLAEFSDDCIKYVIYHEFTHFLYPNHSQNFYGCLSEFCPEWKKYRSILNGNGQKQRGEF